MVSPSSDGSSSISASRLSVSGEPREALRVEGAAVAAVAGPAIAGAVSHLTIAEDTTPPIFNRVKSFLSVPGGELGSQTKSGLDKAAIMSVVSYACRMNGIVIDDLTNFTLSVGAKMLTVETAAGEREIDLSTLLSPDPTEAANATFKQFNESMNRLKADAESVAKAEGVSFTSQKISNGSIKPVSQESIGFATQANMQFLKDFNVERFAKGDTVYVEKMMGCLRKDPALTAPIKFADIVSKNKRAREQIQKDLETILDRQKQILEDPSVAMTEEDKSKKRAALRDLEDLLTFFTPLESYPKLDEGSLSDLKLSLVQLIRQWVGNRDLSLEEKKTLAKNLEELILIDKTTSVWSKIADFFVGSRGRHAEVFKQSSAKSLATETVSMLFHLETSPASGSLRKKYLEFLAHMGEGPHPEDLSDLSLKATQLRTNEERLNCFINGLGLDALKVAIDADADFKNLISLTFVNLT